MSTAPVLISRIAVGPGGTSSVTFSSIPATFTDLKVVASIKNNRPDGVAEDYGVFFNGDTSSSNYSAVELLGSGSGASSRSAYNYGVLVPGNLATASTFNNAEIYIPNYTSANQKSASVDAVTENNATTSYIGLTARLWSGTSAITSLTISNGDSGSTNPFQEFSTFSLYGISKSSNPATGIPYASGGDVITNDGTYWYHAFKKSGTFTPIKNLTTSVLMVAGGGGSGGISGGAGAGGVVYTASQALTNGTPYACTVGAGGAAAGYGVDTVNGNNTYFPGLTTAIGGGSAGTYNGHVYTNGSVGGSGGGSAQGLGSTYGTAISGQGNRGGTGLLNGGGGTNRGGGGGGGAGAVGGDGSSGQSGGNGGAGTNSYSSWATATGTGDSGYYAGGGGAGMDYGSSASTSSGGIGGGGTGYNTSGSGHTGGSGMSNTGGGGGGGGGGSGPYLGGGAGGSGIIIIRYAI